MGSASGTREGDWQCDGCGNRNYAFRSFCNRCKQPRLLVDSKTPADSKWLPRIGDWICTGCSNNNYASREKCNKCGEPKEVAALAATALHEAALTAPGLAYHSADHTGGLGMNYHTGGPGMNLGSAMNSIPSWPGALDWPFGSTADGGNWHPGDWLCACGYHNYSSCLTCKQCQQAPMPIEYFNPGAPLPSVQPPVYSGLGVKRSAPNDLGSDFVNKRLHVGGDYAHPPFQSQGHNFSALPGLGVSVGITGGGTLPSYDWTMPPPPQPLGAMIVPTIIGKGAKQWRAGDWMCSGCNNHNFASRLTCNRCGGQKEIMAQPLPVA